MLTNNSMETLYDNGIYKERFSWYFTTKFLDGFNDTLNELEPDYNSFVYVGGSSFFYRCFLEYGKEGALAFRGLDSADMVSFSPWVIYTALSVMHTSEKGFLYDFSVQNSAVSLDRLIIPLYLGGGGVLEPNFILKIYTNSYDRDKVFLYDRALTRFRCILDPYEKLALSTNMFVLVPSLRDMFILKMDMIDESRSKLRVSDEVDILTLVELAYRQGTDFSYFLRSLDQSRQSYNSRDARVLDLHRLFKYPDYVNSIAPRNYLLFPPSEVLSDCFYRTSEFIKSAGM